MAYVLADRVFETSTSTGVGSFNLAGSTTGFRTFVAGVGTGNTCNYEINNGTDWEIGIGTITAGSPDVLSRDTVTASSNSGAKVNWGSGTKNVFLPLIASNTGIVTTFTKTLLDDADAATARTTLGLGTAATTASTAYATAAQGAKADTALQSGTQAEIEAETSGKGMDGANAKYHPLASKSYGTFNGKGAPAIIGGYNFASITDNGTGDYTVNFTTAMSSTSYTVVANHSVSATNPSTGWASKIYNKTTGGFSIRTGAEGTSGSTLADADLISFIVFGDF